MRAACDATENAPVITACDAIIVAAVANSTIGHSAQPGISRKKGARIAFSSPISSAPWPDVVESQRGQHQKEPARG